MAILHANIKQKIKNAAKSHLTPTETLSGGPYEKIPIVLFLIL